MCCSVLNYSFAKLRTPYQRTLNRPPSVLLHLFSTGRGACVCVCVCVCARRCNVAGLSLEGEW